jgi:ABC-type glutathione transport system ATPase component
MHTGSELEEIWIQESPQSMSNLIEVRNLTLTVPTSKGRASVVENLTFSIQQGEKLGLVGE